MVRVTSSYICLLWYWQYWHPNPQAETAPRSCFWCCAWICPSPHMFPWMSWGSTVDGPGVWIDGGTGKNRNGGLKSHPDPMFSEHCTWNDWALDNCSPHQACQRRRPTSFHSKPQWNSCLSRCITEESTIPWSFIHVYYQCYIFCMYVHVEKYAHTHIYI